MSRVGKKPIEIPNGVAVDFKSQTLTVKGPNGTLTQQVISDVTLELEAKEIRVQPAGEGRKFGAFQGMTRALIANMVTGVSQGFKRNMTLVGVGYRVSIEGKKLVFNVGYSHPIEFALPEGIFAEVGDKGINFSIMGSDKQLVGQTCATIRGFRPPEPYKGKGIRYVDEVVRQKAGKAGAK
jgi:large subunit ribosomal protein L6